METVEGTADTVPVSDIVRPDMEDEAFSRGRTGPGR